MRTKENSPKLYFVVNKRGKFITVENGKIEESSKMCYSRFVRTQQELDLKIQQLEHILNEELDVFVGTEFDFMEELAMITTQTIITGQYFIQLMENIKWNLPTISQINKNLKNSLNNAVKSLYPVNKGFEDFANTKEEATYEVSAHFQETIMLLSEIELYKFSEINALLKAYKINDKSMLGTAKKLLR